MRRYTAITIANLACVLLCVPLAQARNYGLIISAGEATRDDAAVNSCFWYNPLLIYETLIDEGFDPEDVYVLYGRNGTNFNSSHECYQIDYQLADYGTSREKIQLACDALASVMTPSDFLYVWWMGHGGQSGSNLYMYLETTGESVYDYEMADWLAPIAYDIRAASWMTCFSGGILNDLEGPRSIVMSSSTFYESTYDAWLCDTYHAEFHYPERCAWHWETPCGICGPVDADTGNDGVVSFDEAFIYAYNNTVNSTPQISDIGGLAPDTFLGGAPMLHMSFPDGLPELIPPGQPYDISVRISEGEEELVPGSPTLYYRYYGGDFETAPVVPLGGELYQATLPPAHCDAVPEYYFSAEGTESGVIYRPTNAPAETYSFDVGEIILVLADDFETDQGWTVANENLDTGAWVRAIPSGSGGRGDPPSDYDGSGRCYVTGNGSDEDVDGGPTRLTSPVFDVSDGRDYLIGYARWFYNDDGDDTLDVHINNGSGWVLVESVGGRGGWTETSFRVADYVTPTATVQLRFTTADQPNDSVTEAGLDAFSVFAMECEEPGEPILPDDYTIVEGQRVSGGLSDLFESDDSRLVLTHSGFFPPWVELEVVGTATTASPSQLRFTFEGHPTAAQVEQRIKMYDYVAGDWEEVDVRIMPTTDQVVGITISDNPSRFVDPGTLEMKTRIRWMGTSFLNLYGWNAEIDQTVWTVVMP